MPRTAPVVADQDGDDEGEAQVGQRAHRLLVGEGALHLGRGTVDDDRHAPGVVLAGNVLAAVDVGRTGVHPVDAVVVPRVLPSAGDRLPLRWRVGIRLGRLGRDGDARAAAVVVEVGGRGQEVALDRAVGREPQVGLALVALHDDRVALVDRQLEEGVAASDLGLHAGSAGTMPVTSERKSLGPAASAAAGVGGHEDEAERGDGDAGEAGHGADHAASRSVHRLDQQWTPRPSRSPR